MLAILYKKIPKSTQSGQSGVVWVLESEKSDSIRIDPVTGWSGGAQKSFRLSFQTHKAAVDYAKRSGMSWREIGVSGERHRNRKSYADNFSSNRRESWTH